LTGRVAQLIASGRAVLVATDSVEQARQAAAMLQTAGIHAERLDALNDAHEAQVIAAAGQPRAVTVATRMAGRGTDIALHPETARAGGLHVIVCQDNPSARSDRQVIGRCARSGDPGSAEVWRCLDAAAWWPRSGFPGVIDAVALRACRAVTEVTAGPHDCDPLRDAGDPVPRQSSSSGSDGRNPDRGSPSGVAQRLALTWFAWRQWTHDREGARQRRLQLEEDLQWQIRVGSTCV
jgi:preprotein translocase subunit SecA